MPVKVRFLALVALLLVSPHGANAKGLASKDGKKLIPTIVRPGTPPNGGTTTKRQPRRTTVTCVDVGSPSAYLTVTGRYNCENGALGFLGCYGACLPPPPGTPPPPRPNARALVDSAIRNVPDPEPVTSPPLTDDDDVSVVGIPFFYSVPAAQWTTISPTATQGPFFLTINATPTSLSFNPGSSQPGTSCDNPGRSVRTQRQADAAKQLGCYFTYQRAPKDGNTFPAKLTITWSLSVTTNLEPEDYINLVPPTMTTTAEFNVPVIELQPVLVEPGT